MIYYSINLIHQCDAVKIFSELNRYNDLITGGTIAFSFLSSLSGMSEL